MTRLMWVAGTLAMALACTGSSEPAPKAKADKTAQVVEGKKAEGKKAEGKKGREGSTEDVVVDLDKVVALARELRANPETTADVLKASGMTRAQLEAQLYAIAQDPALSDAYVEALK